MSYRAIHLSQLHDPRLYSAPAAVERIWLRLVVSCDNHGRIAGHPMGLQHSLILVGWTPGETADALGYLHRVGLVDWYGPDQNRAVVEITGFQDHQKVRRLGSPSLPGRADNDIDGPELFTDLMSGLTLTTPGVVRDKPGSSPGPVPPINKERLKRSVVDPVDRSTDRSTDRVNPSFDGLSLVADAWRRLTRRKRQLTTTEAKRISQVIKAYNPDDVIGYMEMTLADPWYWQRAPGGRPLIHRRDVDCLFPVKGGNRWDRRMENYLEDVSATVEPTAPTYKPDDQDAADRALLATMGVAS